MASVPKEYLSIAELARQLELPESTVRYYCKRFSQYLPQKGEGRNRRYAPSSLETLRLIAETMRSSKNSYAVDMVLQNSSTPMADTATLAHPPAARPDTPSVQAEVIHGAEPNQFPGQITIMTMLERQTEALQQIAAAMAVFAANHPAVRQTEETHALRSDVQQLRQQLAAADTQHKQDLELTRTWLARFSEAMSQRKI